MFCVLLRSLFEKVEELPTAVDADIHSFIDLLEREPFDQNSLKRRAALSFLSNTRIFIAISYTLKFRNNFNIIFNINKL